MDWGVEAERGEGRPWRPSSGINRPPLSAAFNRYPLTLHGGKRTFACDVFGSSPLSETLIPGGKWM